MVVKKYLIEFDEQSKAVVAKVSITTEIDSAQSLFGSATPEGLLQEAQELFDKAQEFAKLKTLDKMR